MTDGTSIHTSYVALIRDRNMGPMESKPLARVEIKFVASAG